MSRVLQDSGARGRLEVAVPSGRTPGGGREAEGTRLLAWWEPAQSGQGHVVLVTGDAGLGKARLVQMRTAHVTHAPHGRWECRSVPYDQNPALYPVTDL